MPKTAIAAAFEKAGMPMTEVRLRTLALDAMRKHHNNIARALPTLDKAVGDQRDLIRAALEFVLRDVGHSMNYTHSGSVGVPHPDGADAGQGSCATHTMGASTAPTHRGGEGLGRIATPRNTALPVRGPSRAQRRAAGAVAKTIAITIFDTYRIRDGRSIGDVKVGELERLRSANTMEAAVIRQIQRHATADPDSRIRDVIKADDLQRFIQKAAEVADAT